MNAGKICLESHLDMDALPALAQALRNALAEKAPLLLDGSRVKSINGAALQLLLAATQSAQQADISFNWHQPSPPLERAVELLGLSNDLELGGNKE